MHIMHIEYDLMIHAHFYFTLTVFRINSNLVFVYLFSCLFNFSLFFSLSLAIGK